LKNKQKGVICNDSGQVVIALRVPGGESRKVFYTSPRVTKVMSTLQRNRLPVRETRPLVTDLPCLSWTAGAKEPFVKVTGTFARAVHGSTYLVYQQPNLQKISCSGPSVTSTVCVGSITSGVSKNETTRRRTVEACCLCTSISKRQKYRITPG
jgi:hypothetical protein